MPNRDRPQTSVERICQEKGLRLTGQRRVIAQVLSSSHDHPDVECLHQRCQEIDSNISLATVYRTLKLLESMNIIERHEFGDGRSRYEEYPDEHHDHLIDIQTGQVIEFQNPQIEALQQQIAQELGYELVDHRLELYCVPKGARKETIVQ